MVRSSSPSSSAAVGGTRASVRELISACRARSRAVTECPKAAINDDCAHELALCARFVSEARANAPVLPPDLDQRRRIVRRRQEDCLRRDSKVDRIGSHASRDANHDLDLVDLLLPAVRLCLTPPHGHEATRFRAAPARAPHPTGPDEPVGAEREQDGEAAGMNGGWCACGVAVSSRASCSGAPRRPQSLPPASSLPCRRGPTGP